MPIANSTALRSAFQRASGGKRKNIATSCWTGYHVPQLFSTGGAMARTQAERIAGGFILISGLDGIRYAVRLQSVGIIHDADECHDETIIQLHGGHVVRVTATLAEVLAWRSEERRVGKECR